MARRKSDSPQKAALRERMGGYLKNNDVRIKDSSDVKSIMRNRISILLEGALDAEMNEELGYSGTILKTRIPKDVDDNSRNGHSKKTRHTDYGETVSSFV